MEERISGTLYGNDTSVPMWPVKRTHCSVLSAAPKKCGLFPSKYRQDIVDINGGRCDLLNVFKWQHQNS